MWLPYPAFKELFLYNEDFEVERCHFVQCRVDFRKHSSHSSPLCTLASDKRSVSKRIEWINLRGKHIQSCLESRIIIL